MAAAYAASSVLNDLPVSIFCAGSLARGEVGEKSDLDVFVVTSSDDRRLRSRLCEYSLFAELMGVNRDLGLPEFSNDGEYLKICFLDDLKHLTGSRRDDSENLFTTRMLLILESQPLLHQTSYDDHLTAVLRHYYRDNVGKRSFRPLFLLNDLLRYWRTLCLNYEDRRHDTSRPWRKKNVNLKFSRMVTVFSTVFPLVLSPSGDVGHLFDLCRRPALERLASALDELGDDRLTRQWPLILDAYEEFLTWKEDEDLEHSLERAKKKDLVRIRAEQVSEFLYSALTHERIKPEYRRYLVL